MKSCEYCQNAGAEKSRSPSRWRRVSEVAGWLIPSATLVLLPKCPVCVAMYVGLISGVGISLASAARLREMLLWVSIGMLICVMLWRWWRFLSRNGRGGLSFNEKI